jgi:hypothetical protein
MLSHQQDRQDQLEVLRNDARVRAEREERERRRELREPSAPTTFSQFVQSDADVPRDRFHEVNSGSVVGAKSDIAGLYPAASAALSVQLPDEPPLGLDNPALESPFIVSEALATPTPAVADVAPPTTGVEKRSAGVGFSQTDDDPATFSQRDIPDAGGGRGAGSSSPRREIRRTK